LKMGAKNKEGGGDSRENYLLRGGGEGDSRKETPSLKCQGHRRSKLGGQVVIEEG